MPGIIAFPHIVQEAVRDFYSLFANDPQRRHFAEYLTGLFVADHKTVLGIHDEFAQITDQSCLNRFLTDVDWDPLELNTRRLELLQKDPATRYANHGVIAIDNVLIDHDGKLIPDACYFWDHAEERFKIAQDYLFANYVCPSGKHYPLDFRCFCSKKRCTEERNLFVNHTSLCIELIDQICDRNIPGDFTFDNYFTNAEILNHIHSKALQNGQPRAYVGDLKSNRKVTWKGRTLKANQVAAQVPPESRNLVQVGDRRQYYFTVCLHIPNINHKIRLVLLWKNRDDNEAVKMLITNRTTWEVSRILRVYRHRWTGTETFHRDGKQQLGMGDCQLRDPEGQTRHMYLVMLAYSLLMQQMQQSHPLEWAYQKLMTIGEACRAILRETLRKTLTWAIGQVTEKAWDVQHIVTYLNLGGVPCTLSPNSIY
jgi:DDE superfamily endonuclease